MKISIKDQTFELLSQRALYWENESMLIIGDLHLGKVAHFNKNGIGLPQKIATQDLERLSELIRLKAPKTFCILGDLFHSDYNSEWNLFRKFRAEHASVEFLLVKGNHDSLHPSFYRDLPMKVAQSYVSHGIMLIHDGKEKSDEFVISAHIHPSYTLSGKGRQAIRLSCFYRKETELIIPAFGKFTGTHAVKKKSKEIIYALANEKIIEIC